MMYHHAKHGIYGINESTCDIYKPLYEYMIEKQYDLLKAYMNQDHIEFHGAYEIMSINFKSKLWELMKNNFKVSINNNIITIDRI